MEIYNEMEIYIYIKSKKHSGIDNKDKYILYIYY